MTGFQRFPNPRQPSIHATIVSNTHIQLSAAARRALGNTNRVNLLHNPDQHLIAIEPAADNDPGSYALSSNSTIHCSVFLRHTGAVDHAGRRHHGTLDGNRIVLALTQPEPDPFAALDDWDILPCRTRQEPVA